MDRALSIGTHTADAIARCVLSAILQRLLPCEPVGTCSWVDTAGELLLLTRQLTSASVGNLSSGTHPDETTSELLALVRSGSRSALLNSATSPSCRGAFQGCKPVPGKEEFMWMRSCPLCKSLLKKLHLYDSLRCQCGWEWK